MSWKNHADEDTREKFLNRIFRWDPEWLEGDKYKNLPPPVIDVKKLKPALLSYDSYDDYYDIMKPLLALEFWFKLKHDYDNDDKKKAIEGSVTAGCYDHERCINSSGDINFKFQLHVSIPTLGMTKFPPEKYPVRGDLVTFESPYNGEELFAVVEHVRTDRRSIKDGTVIFVYYTLSSKPIILKSPWRLTIKTVTNISSHLVLSKSLQYISQSYFETLILRPTIESYELSPLDEADFPPLLITEDNLNTTQLEVLARIKSTVYESSSKICLIQGPPGTGKSQLIVNIVASLIIEQTVRRILVCAHSNQAIDEVTIRLLKLKEIFDTNGVRFNVVRIGQEDRMNDLVKKISPSSLAACSPLNFFHMMNENQLKREQDILEDAHVIASTLTSCCGNQMCSIFGYDQTIIPVCIIDEAGQATELATVAPLILGVRKLILIGDTKQLRPTVISKKAAELGYDMTLFARAEKIFARAQLQNPIIMLDTQYRMVNSIAHWPNRYFYGGAIKNAPIVYPILSVVPYKLLNHRAQQDDGIYSNLGEAQLVVNLIYTIVTEAQLGDGISIGIITPYKKQQRLIIELKKDRFKDLSKEIQDKITVLDVNTVDSFQGSERDVIIISCVRSRGIGFINDPHRLCVSLTRAKRSLIICGNFNTFERNSMWRNLIHNAQDRGVYVTVDYDANVNTLKQHVILNRCTT